MGKNLVFMPECHSTNSLALKLCQQSPLTAEGTVVITSNQTAGRGQRGNTWHSEPGKNLTFSIVLRPNFLPVNDLFYLNIFSSLALHDYLSEKGCPSVNIKWPNDIYVQEKKICGLLVENLLQGNELNGSVLGIGLNINQERFDVDHATSLSVVLNRQLKLQEELEILLTKIEVRYLQLRANKLSGLMEDYLQAMYWLNEAHSFTSFGDTFEGTICGVDRSGRLRVRIGDRERVFETKEIRYER
jgi:BirA family transcriptional regulator, biotin operon repressor / biotin---[acetyl-CoA-carboxylase] ligase